MNIIKNKKYIPVIIKNGGNFIGFVATKHLPKIKEYLYLMGPSQPLKNKEKVIENDCVFYLTPKLYFEISRELKYNGKKYNIKKYKYELNNKRQQHWYNRFF